MSRVPRIEDTIKDMNRMVFAEGLTGRELAIVVEANQKYMEYLDDLATARLDIPPQEVIVRVDGQTTIKFNNIDDLSNWLAENMT